MLVGLVRQDLDLTPGWPAFGWLAALAVTGQFLGWLLIGAALPRLPAKEGGSIPLVRPVLAVLLGMALLGERLSGWRAAGRVIVVLAVWDTTRARRPAAEPAARTRTRARARGVRPQPPRRGTNRRTARRAANAWRAAPTGWRCAPATPAPRP
ncbi:DMT family transporter [Streptomyces buecherae]|uniref:DMT family transporter n=1 Tax=Streptomyces buecherae TaxID=2763006 RepID=UPI0033DDDDD5